MAAEQSDELVQVLLFALLGAAYAIVWIVKKADRWIQVHRLPRDRRPSQSAAASEQRASPAPAPQPDAKAPQRDVRSLLMEELERALRGADAVSEPRPSPPQPPVVAPPPAPPRGRRVEAARRRPMPAPPHALPAADGPRHGAVVLGAGGIEMTASGNAIEKSAAVARESFGHLAALRSQEDLKRAVVLHEILSPPVSLRSRGAAGLRAF